MIFYCPRCWAEVPGESERCPVCGRSLAADDEDFVDKPIAALRHPEPTRATLAAQILGELMDPRAIQPLIDLLNTDRDTYVLRYAVEALGRFADQRAVPSLCRLLTPATHLIVRLAAVEARAALRQALSDPSLSVRDLARQALKLHEEI